MGDFYLTMRSDSSPDHFPLNTITSFRNKFSLPLTLDSYEVALVDCTYVHSERMIKKDELLGKQYIVTSGSSIADNTIRKLSASNLQDRIVRIYAQQDIHSLEELIEDLKSSNVNISLSHHRLVNDNGMKWTEKLNNIFGYENREYMHEVFFKSGQTQLFLYCDIIELQRVGNEMAPLLRAITHEGKHRQITYRTFQHLQYVPVTYDYVEFAHMYILNENGLPPPFTVGSFSATLHFRRKQF
jgi:hypothetical protein